MRVDSKVAEDIAEGGGKNDEARRLRFVLETIGKTAWPGAKVPEEYAALVDKHNHKALEDDDNGLVTRDASVPPGRDVRCIISVAMLSEGWDATTVTHVVGLRPFGSQLLCEQVVGRALRRTSYAVDEATGFFREETAQVFGVPFELIPFKVKQGTGPSPTPAANQIYAVPAKAEHEIIVPVVEGYTDPGITRLAVDWSKVPTLVLDPMEVPDTVLMKGLTTQDGALAAYGPGVAAVVNLDAWRKRVRVQQVAFTLAKVVAQQWRHEQGDTIPMHRLFPQLLGNAQQFLNSKLDCRGNRVPQDVALNPYFQRAAGVLFDALQAVDDSGKNQERPVIMPGPAGERSTRHIEFYTGRQPWPVEKCHLNAMVADTKTWEQSAATALDAHAAVLRWVKNDHLGFQVPYRKDGVRRRYLPDFIVDLTNGERLIVEIKGQTGDAEVKAAAAHRWCNAVNNDGRFGRWSYHLVKQPPDLMKLLDERMRTGERVSVRAALDVQARLHELALLSDGWFDGDGLKPSEAGLAWFSNSWTTHWPTGIPLPYLYPTLAGGLQLEWSFATASASIDIDLARRVAELMVSRTADGDVLDEGVIDLTAPEGWKTLADAVRRHAKTQVTH